MASRRERFDELVLDSAERIEPVLQTRGTAVEFAVEDVPPSDPTPWEDAAVPLGRLFPGHGSLPTRIVVYRRPVESRSGNERELAVTVHDVIVEQVSVLLGVSPEEVDPRYGAGE